VREPATFPWEEAMAAALSVLPWSPRHFWSATPRELAAALSISRPRAPEPLSADGLARLLRAFPDKPGGGA
jgi:uncharacterized phage protein (TIGR02216 family)